MRQTALLAAATLCLLLSGCVALLGLGAGVIISQDVLDNETYVAQLNEDVDVVWAVAKSSLSHQSDSPITVENDLRTATGLVDGADVIVSVEAFDLDRCRMSVSATKYDINNGEIAELVFDRILKQLRE